MHRLTRWTTQTLCRILLPFLARLEVTGLQEIPKNGPLLLVTNHFSHLDPLLILAVLPNPPEAIALQDNQFPRPIGMWLRAYRAIPITRDGLDLSALRRSHQALKVGRIVGLAPEGRISATAHLGEGMPGAAYLALKTGSPILPVAIIGAETALSLWKRCRRPSITIRFGPTFSLDASEPYSHGRIQRATDEIMRRIAELLPPSARGSYAACAEATPTSTAPMPEGSA